VRKGRAKNQKINLLSDKSPRREKGGGSREINAVQKRKPKGGLQPKIRTPRESHIKKNISEVGHSSRRRGRKTQEVRELTWSWSKKAETERAKKKRKATKIVERGTIENVEGR